MHLIMLNDPIKQIYSFEISWNAVAKIDEKIVPKIIE